MPAVSMIQNYIILLNINTCIHVGISWSVKYMKNMVKERQLCYPLSQSWNSFIPELWNDFNNFHQASLAGLKVKMKFRIKYRTVSRTVQLDGDESKLTLSHLLSVVSNTFSDLLTG